MPDDLPGEETGISLHDKKRENRMATQVIMPVLGLTMESGTIVEWMKQEGDAVAEGEVLFTVETDKSVMEVEAKTSGVLLKIVHGPGESVPIQQVIGYIGERGESIPTDGAGAPAPAASAGETPAARVAPPAPAPEPRPGGRIKASPAARKRAKELGIPLEQLIGTGPGGRIVRMDVEQFAAAQAAAKPEIPVAPKPAAAPAPAGAVEKREASRTPLSGKRRIAATRLTQSATTVPHFYLTIDIDMTAAVALRASLNELAETQGRPRVSFNDMLIKAAALALRESPAMNASLDGDTVVQYADVHVGFAVALEDGLVVPVVAHADQRSVYEIAETTQTLEAKARSSGLTPYDYGYGTFTISNLGMFGVDRFTAIINPPEAAILAVGRIKKTPVVEDDHVIVRSIMSVTLSSDHRIVDGAVAAQFLDRLRRMLKQPLALLIPPS